MNSPDEQLRAIIDTIPALVWSARPDGSGEFFNSRWLEYAGVAYDEVRDWGWKKVVHPEDLSRLVEYYRLMLASGEPGEIEARLRRFDGEFRWFLFRANPLRDESGAVVRWYGTNIDIEDRKRAEEAAQTSELSFRQIVETMPALVWCASSDGELTYVNQRILDYTGASLGDLAKAGWVSFLHPDDVQQTVAMWTNAVRTGTPHDVQYRLRKHDGTYRWFHVLGQAMADADGLVIQWYGLLIDIDDRKNIQEALRRTETRLTRATQIATVGELSASIAHEINQPLGAVVTNAYACLRWLSAEPPNLVKAREAAERIVRDGKDTVEVVGRIRALFKRRQLQHEATPSATQPDAGAFSARDNAMSTLDSKYSAVRSMTRSLAASLSAEDQMIQSCPDASPVKWHQAHTTWFFETFVLRPYLGDYKPFREEFHRLFNSYYISLGEEIPEKKLRSSFSRPSLDEVVAFRAHVDREMAGAMRRFFEANDVLGRHEKVASR